MPRGGGVTGSERLGTRGEREAPLDGELIGPGRDVGEGVQG